MKTSLPNRRRTTGCAMLLALGTLAGAGCVATTGGYTTEYAPGPAPVIVDDDDYVYYPSAEVYYSTRYHNYVYRDGSRWVARREPPRMWSRTAPSVPMVFHDSPEHHHAEVMRSYPRTWHPTHVPEHRDRDDRDRDDRR